MSSENIIGLVGGISWESTREYYTLLNENADKSDNSWRQPKIVVDSLDFAEFAMRTQERNWHGMTEMLVASAKRLESAGATHIALAANTAHVGFEAVQESVDLPVLDIRVAVAQEVKRQGKDSISLLGTKATMLEPFYREKLKELGINSYIPSVDGIEELQRMIYQELTVGIVKPETAELFTKIAEGCIAAGGEVVGLCCTEFGLLFPDVDPPFAFLDSTSVHVEYILAETGYGKS